MKPERCPRCGRSNDTWRYEKAAEFVTRGGCECGEVIELVSDDLADPSFATVAEKPADWREDDQLDRWSASVGSFDWRLPAGAVLGALGIAVVAGSAFPTPLSPLLVGAFLYVIGFCSVAMRWRRRWTFAIADNVFRADALGQHVEVPLADVQGFAFVPPVPTRYSNARTLMVLRKTQSPVKIPLFLSRQEAQFLLDRLRAKHETEGRSIDRGYRGEPLRIATDDDRAREAEAEAEAAAEAESLRESARRIGGGT